MSAERYALAACEHCGQHIEFPAEGAGARVPCPHCGLETVLIEQLVAEQGSGPAAEEITAAELQSALTAAFARPRVSVFYQFGLLIVALFMVLLPVVYLAFATACGYATYWYAMHARGLLASFQGGVYVFILKAILYLGPLVGGVVAVFFMFKPILARSPKRAEPLELNPAQHPRLYQFIAHISDLLRVAMPKRIYLDCDVNAGAGFRRGFLSFLGSDQVLTLGLPLVAGFNTRQFAAVVAHELGHCTQAMAMRLGFIIDRVDRWFGRVVFQRDAWDEALDEWANDVEDWRLSLVVACAHLAVFLSRRVLALLMLIGHAASCFLSRQMEYHADRCAISIAGSEGLETMLLRLRELGLLEQTGYQALHQIWQKRHQLPESLPAFLDQLESRLPPAFHEQARLTLLNETAGLFATHPTPAQRIQKARQRADAGIFNLPKPARLLFDDFAAASSLVTSRHYRQNLRLAITPPMLKPASDFFSSSPP